MFTAALADKLIRALPVIEGVPLGSKRYEIIPNVLDCQEDSTALNRQRVRQSLRQVSRRPEFHPAQVRQNLLSLKLLPVMTQGYAVAIAENCWCDGAQRRACRP